ncbi:MAG: T9SS type A sorting domain-containing protein [Sphingobacteriaceae bacterium]|nr:T9SS type A sorting domain-containing protein [Sphingobacteriaceae bacterium]
MKKALLLLITLILLNKEYKAQTWAQLTDFPSNERDDGTAFVINNKAYCGSGLQVGWGLAGDFHYLDLGTETWSTVASMPAGKERQYACGFTDGTNGFVFGGEAFGSNLNDLWMYSPTTNSWTAMASKPGNGVRGASYFVIGNVAYIVGGASAPNDAINEVWAYDMSTNIWTQKNNLPITNWRGGGAATNGKGYLLYGMNSVYAYNRYLYEYDPLGDNWTYKSTFAGPGTGKVYANMQAINNDLVIFGGKDSLNACNNQLWSYNLTNNTWLSVSTLTATLRKGGMGFTNGGTYYYTCGISQADVRLKETWKTAISVGINEFEKKEELGIFPNPASETITVSLPKNSRKNYEILDATGRISISGALENDKINVSSLSPGLYFLVCGSHSSKLIIQ